jgi:uncharacterized membrane protein
MKQKPSFGQRAADGVANTVGSWKFIIIQSFILACWIVWNILPNTPKFDEKPFILLNLLLSFQAAYTAPMIMMSQNRQAEIDRRKAEADYIVNRIAKSEIEAIQAEIMELKGEIVGKNTHKARLQQLVDRLEDVQDTLKKDK